MFTSLIALALLGCKQEEIPVDPPIGLFVDSDEVTGFEIVDAVGNAPLSTYVRAVNQFGASIASEPQGFTVDGASVPVQFDSLGYGTLTVQTEGTFEVDDGDAVRTMHVLQSEWPGVGLSRAFASPADDPALAAGIGTGTVVAQGTDLWWVGPGLPAHQVLKGDGPIRGVQGGHIDVDGVEDVIAWTNETVFLLRGRLGGGVAWGTALRSERHTVGGAAIGELTNDNLPDVVVAWSALEGTSKLDIFHGDGLFGFTPAEPRNLPGLPSSVSIGDTTGEGKQQITVLAEDGLWSRYIAGSDVRYMPVGPRTPSEIAIPLGSVVEAVGDLNGDGGDELWFIGPLTPGTIRNILVVDLLGTKIEFLPLQPLAAYVDRADLDGNGLVDQVELHGDQELRSLSFDETSTNSYTPRALGDLPDYGPIVASDMVDHDGVADLFVAGRTFWWWWRGENSPNDSDVFWGLGEQAMVERGATTGPIAIVEMDSDPVTTHVLGFELVNADTYFTIWEHNTATQAVTSANVLLSASGLEPLDLAVCGDRAWVVLSGKAMTVDISDLTAPVKGVEASTAGTRIDCGAGPGGAEAALLGDGQVQWVDVNIAQQSLLTTPGAEDVAVGDVGNGTEVRTCDDEGCSIVYWTWGATTAEAGFASGSSDSLGVADADGTRLLTGYGQLSVGDVDGNGFDDLVGIGADGLISVHRSNGVAMHHGEYFHTRNPPTTALAIGDADGDGFADFWMRDADDRLLFTVAPIIAGETTTTTGSPTATDTGDTGLP